MEIFKDIYTEEWGDRGGVTEGLVQQQPPCQALTIPSLIQQIFTDCLPRPATSEHRGSSGEQGRQGVCLCGASTLLSL